MILTWDDLAQYRGLVTLVDGSFDPLHRGHLQYFHVARSFGSPLVVNICPDTYTQTKHPILLPAHERAHLINELAVVKYVHVSERPTMDVLHQLQPKVYCKGDDWRERLPDEQIQACVEYGTTIAYTKTVQQSSTQLLAQFQPDVDAFEQLVLSQTPAEKPWEPTAAVPYDFESRKIAEGKHPELIRDVFQPRKVLDVGCGPGHLMTMLESLGIHCQGLDVAAKSSRIRDRITSFDVGGDQGESWESDYWAADLVTCREVLEHLTIQQIRRAVTNLCRLSSKYVYLTTRFSEARHFLDFATSDDLDPTHISIMPQAWLRHLFTLEGFKRRADLEQRMDWQQKGRVLVYERAA